MALATDGDSAERGFQRLSSLFLPPQHNLQRCQRCCQPVYQQERIGPVNDVVFHKGCFKCVMCGSPLSLKNYWTNQGDSNDREIYCQRHAPRIGGSRMDKDAVGIKRNMATQDNFRKASSKLNEVRYQGEQPTFAFGKDAIGIKGVMANKENGGVKATSQAQAPYMGMDANALGIRGDLDAQLLQKRYTKKNMDAHHFPPHIAKKREQIFEAQKKLEEQLKKEEDEMFRTFRAEREQTKDEINRGIEVEWEAKLKDLTEKFSKDMDKKKKKIKDDDKKQMTIQFETEKKELASTMKYKKEKDKKTMTLRLRKKEQEQTSDLVKKQSHVMLEMLRKEQEELKVAVAKELAAALPEPQTNGGPEETLEEILEEISATQVTLVAAPPSPKAPELLKEDLFVDETVFQQIDEQVVKVAEHEQGTWTDLVRQLTEGLMDDLGKARAIYRWICVKDLNVIEFEDDLDADTPMGLLRGIKLGTETYHVLFMRLCSYAGLHCEEIKGHSKSVGYEPGMKINPEIFNNTWNAVMVAGEWRLIQCNWGARHLVMSKDKGVPRPGKDQIRYQYDEHYFMTNPDEFIQEFWPLESKWQLLESPITLEEFEALPFVRSIFFQYKMRFDGHKLAVVNTDDKGGAKITIQIPEQLENDLVFFYQLRYAEKEKAKETTYRGSPLERFVFQTMLDNIVTFSVHVPTPGSYFMEVFANKIDASGRVEENNANVAPFKLKCACKFKIVCETLMGKMHPLPNCAAGEWGPKKALRHFGITPLTTPSSEFEMEKVGMLTVEDNFELKFKTPHAYQFVAKLRMNHVESKILDPFVNLTSEGLTFTVYVSLPQPGQYGLDIFAKPKGANDSSTLSHSCKYLINCTKVESAVEIPKVKSESKKSKFGPTPAFEELGMKLITPKESKVQVDNTDKASVQIKVPSHISLSFQFLREPDEDNRDYITQTRDSKGVITMNASMPKKGNYMLCLYAKKEKGDDKSAPNVYNFLFQNVPEDKNKDKDPERKSSIFKKGLFKSSKSKSKDEGRRQSRDGDLNTSDRSSISSGKSS